MNQLTYKFGLGDIYTVAKDAISYAKKHQTRGLEPVEVVFVFNGVEVIAYSSSEPRDVVEKYYLRHNLRRLELGHE